MNENCFFNSTNFNQINCSINEAFDKLRHLLPWLSHDRKMSKVTTLREAIRYIKQLSQLLNGEPPSPENTSRAVAAKSETDRPSLIIPNSDGIQILNISKFNSY